MMSNKLPELRQDRRYNLPGTFVINANGVGEILNVSHGGLSFGCVKDRELPESLTIDIVNSRGVHIWDIPVEKVWLKRCDSTYHYSIHTTIVGARFTSSLSPDQKAALDELISSLL